MSCVSNSNTVNSLHSYFFLATIMEWYGLNVKTSMLEDHTEFKFDFCSCMVHSYKECLSPTITNWFCLVPPFLIYLQIHTALLIQHLARVTVRRSTLVRQETNNHACNVVRTTSLVCFLHQSLCCLLRVRNRFNHGNSFLNKGDNVMRFRWVARLHDLDFWVYKFISLVFNFSRKVIANFLEPHIM